MGGSGDIVATARRIADEVLFPAAVVVDRAAAVPRSHLDALAGAGLYGVAGPAEAGGTDLDLPTFGAVIEALASGCLATAFVWIQHHGLVRALSRVPPDTPPPPGVPAGAAELRATWLAPLCRAERRAGIALAGLLPGPPRLRARPTGAGWLLDGSSPWVTGWDRVDALYTVARGPDDTVVALLLDAVEQPGLVARRQRLVGVDASCTVELEFTDLAVPADRVISVDPWQPPPAGPALRVNGSLALGLVARCCRLSGPSGLDTRLAACRRMLDEALAEEAGNGMAAARAASAELALHAAAAAVVHAGSRSILLDAHAQRLSREATFLLVFGTRAPIRAALLDRLTR
jgi:alkylation response protein AidB-like acyl-CoA dehydrogenase